jgi:hypothetical protein
MYWPETGLVSLNINFVNLVWGTALFPFTWFFPLGFIDKIFNEAVAYSHAPT